ncbi:MAG: hypothetical protein KTR30_14375, partial [Saprospiraceae bacterium]|nr:hypothetical protein [Saprospiraceae bacterium]
MNKILIVSFCLSMIYLMLMGCQAQKTTQTAKTTDLPTLMTEAVSEKAKVMVLGTYHFRQEQNYDELSPENQAHIERILTALAAYQPTKVVIEWEPSRSEKVNQIYQSYLEGSFKIDTLPNEVFQLGFRMAQKMGHDSIYLFDDKTPYIGSLADFTFEKLVAYAKQNDQGFFNRYESSIGNRYKHNEQLLTSQNLYDNLLLRNSPEAIRVDAERMHMYEMRVGIQKNWMGPDWLGRYYQRNIRMMSNVLKSANTENDRIL